MALSIIFAVLGIPLSWLSNWSYEKIKDFASQTENIPLKTLFLKAFYRSLDGHSKGHRSLVKKLKKDIQDYDDWFMDIFASHAGDYNSLISALNDQSFYGAVAVDVVKRYGPEGKKFEDKLVEIVKDSMQNYQFEFFKAMTEKEGIQLMLLLQAVTTEKIMATLESMDDRVAGKLEAVVNKMIGEGKLPALATPEEKKKKQVKILSVTAVPDDEDELLYEREQDTLLDAFSAFNTDEVYADMPDPVNSTLKEISAYLVDGKHDILHITAHGQINEKGEGYLCLEDEEGKLERVTGKELFDTLKKLDVIPRIVILTSCHSARKEPELMPAARALFEAGIDTVIGMQKAVTHEAAIEFNAEFFAELCRKKTVKQAFEAGKQAIFTGEQRRVKEIKGWDAIKEYEIPQLLTRDENLTVDRFSDFRIAAPRRPESHRFMGAKYLERGFIGRRRILRCIYKAVENRVGAVVLKGPGGIGKSTLTTRAAATLSRKGYQFIVIQNETSIEGILEAVSHKAAALGVEGAEQVFKANADEMQKLNWYLDNFLLKQKVVIILDNFEENQDAKKGGAFKKERLKKFLWFFRDSLENKPSVLFFSTRYLLPGFEALEIGEFSNVEFRKKLLGGKALQRLEGKYIHTLRDEVGGNPRALELLDTIAYQEFGGGGYSWQALVDLLPEMRKRILHRKTKDDDFTPLFIQRLLGYLSESQRRVLDVLSIFRIPVPGEALTALEVTMKRGDRRKLGDLSLLVCIHAGAEEQGPVPQGPLFYVHRLTAQYLLGRMKAKERNSLNIRTAEYFAGIRTEEGKVYLDDLIEARGHFIQAGKWNRAADLTFDLEEYLTLHGYTHRAMELLQELDMKKLGDEYQAVAHNRLGLLFQHFGDYHTALLHYKKALEIDKKSNNSQNVAGDLHQIGMIYQEQGRYDDALKQYEEGIKIFRDLGAQKEIAAGLHQIGRIYEWRGRYDAALKQYKQAMEIAERVGDIKGIAITLNQIGIIYNKQGQYDAALKQYQQSLEIRERIGDTKGIAQSLHQIGNIYFMKGDYNAALKWYLQSLEIKEKIGDINGVALTMAQMGSLNFQQNQWETALELLIQAHTILDKIGAAPNAKLVKEYIDEVREKMGEEKFMAVIEEMKKGS